jgi:hypothetical protein
MWGNNEAYNPFYDWNKLRSCTWQYSIRHESVLKFQIGDVVFLKCNPDFPIKVIDIDILNNKVKCYWKNINHEKQYCDFPPETILHYRYASLVQARSKTIQIIQINLN